MTEQPTPRTGRTLDDPLLARTMLLPFLRHRATCYLQAVRDNAPWDDLCDCDLRDRWLALEEAQARTEPTPRTEAGRRHIAHRLSIGEAEAIRDILAIEAQARTEALDVDVLADALHAKACGPFTTIDPQQCVAGRDRDVRLAAAIAREYAAILAAKETP